MWEEEESWNFYVCPWVNFTNILRAAFTRADPQSAKKLLNLTVFFALLGSGRVKAACRTLVKLTPRCRCQTLHFKDGNSDFIYSWFSFFYVRIAILKVLGKIPLYESICRKKGFIIVPNQSFVQVGSINNTLNGFDNISRIYHIIKIIHYFALNFKWTYE